MSQFFWFQTRQSLLTEWGYTPGVWHLIRRTSLSMSLLSLSTGEYTAVPASRVVLALLDPAECEWRGPIEFDDLGVVNPGHRAGQPVLDRCGQRR